MTEDGYAVLEPGGHDSVTIVNHPKEYISPGHGMMDDQDHDYEELYWEPANQEEELLSQLSKLGLPVIHEDCIEYVLIITGSKLRFPYVAMLCLPNHDLDQRRLDRSHT